MTQTEASENEIIQLYCIWITDEDEFSGKPQLQQCSRTFNPTDFLHLLLHFKTGCAPRAEPYLLHSISPFHSHAQKKKQKRHFSSILLVQITSIMQMLNSLSFKLFSLGLGRWGYWWSHPGHLSISFPLSLFVFWFCAAAPQTAENTQHKHDRPFNLPVVISPPLTYIALQAVCFMKNI